jgi:hypothetical protein
MFEVFGRWNDSRDLVFTDTPKYSPASENVPQVALALAFKELFGTLPNVDYFAIVDGVYRRGGLERWIRDESGQEWLVVHYLPENYRVAGHAGMWWVWKLPPNESRAMATVCDEAWDHLAKIDHSAASAHLDQLQLS